MGDLVLSTVGKLMQRQLPPPALCARYGGEEFLVALPGSTLLEAGFAIDALVAALREANPAPSIPELKIRISGGLVAYRPEADKSLEDAVRRADQLLYTAKRAGRDRYYRDGDELPTFTSRRASDRPPSTG
jgi:diguanylate cyclase (GGDEF)-like protein